MISQPYPQLGSSCIRFNFKLFYWPIKPGRHILMLAREWRKGLMRLDVVR